MTSGSDRLVTEADFERLSWHDNLIYGIAFETADPAAEDWRSDLVLDIDHIVEWVCDADRTTRFRVAPASLVFHGITDFSIMIDWGKSDFRTGLQLPSIDRIERERIVDRKVYLDRPYYRWRIALNAPRGGHIAFGAVNLTQTPRAEPILQTEQWIAPVKRRAMLTR